MSKKMIKLSERLSEVEEYLPDSVKTQILDTIKRYKPLIHENDFAFINKDENIVEIYSWDTEKLKYVTKYSLEVDVDDVELEYAAYLGSDIHVLGGNVKRDSTFRLWTQRGEAQNLIVESEDIDKDDIVIGKDKVFVNSGTKDITVFEIDSSGKVSRTYKIKDISSLDAVIDEVKDIYLSVEDIGSEGKVRNVMNIWKLIPPQESQEFGTKQILSTVFDIGHGNITVIGKTIRYDAVHRGIKYETKLGRMTDNYEVDVIGSYAFGDNVKLLSEFTISIEPEGEDRIEIERFKVLPKGPSVSGKKSANRFRIISSSEIPMRADEQIQIVGISDKVLVIGEGFNADTETLASLEIYRARKLPKQGYGLNLREGIAYDKIETIDGELYMPYSIGVSKETIEKTSGVLQKYINISLPLMNVISRYI